MDQGISPTSDVVEGFLEYYSDSGYLAYEKLAEQARRILIHELDKHDIDYEIFARGQKGSVTAGAKLPASTRQTIIRRQRSLGRDYKTRQEILDDMHDLAGIRIALYHPDDFQTVEKIINDRLVEVKPPQDWPDKRFGPFAYPTLDRGTSERQSRFPGYFARHYRVRLREQDVTESAIEGKTFEVQLMTLLMHAWSKMHYELIYKPRPGLPPVDDTDERLLDISNGVIIAGEQILRQIQINLNKKKEMSRRPFSNEHDVWSYLNQKWFYSEETTFTESEKASREANSHLETDRKHILYESVQRIKFDTPERLDLLVEHGHNHYGCSPQTSEDKAHNPSTRAIGRDFIDLMIISIVDQDVFKALESKELCIPLDDAQDLDRSELLKLVRYKALIICNALRQYESNSLHAVWECRGDFDGTYPSGQEFLGVLHPSNTTLQSSRALPKLLDFCDYLLRWDDETWRLHCAIARLGYFGINSPGCRTEEKGILGHEFAMTRCPFGLIRLLDYSAENEAMALSKSFIHLEYAERCNNRRVGHSRHYTYLQEQYRNYRCPSVVLQPKLALSCGEVGVWELARAKTPMVVDHVHFHIVREYLDRLGGNKNAT